MDYEHNIFKASKIFWTSLSKL
ncbi:MAG: hypothetical protein ACTSRS_07010 [Candidatus Helarchaeota archaeon]